MIKNTIWKSTEKNIRQYMEYINKISSAIWEYVSKDGNFLEGNYDLNIDSYIRRQKINYEGETIDQIIEEIRKYFKCIPDWSKPGTMINIIPPVNMLASSIASMVLLYNPNIAQDTYSGYAFLSELEVVKYFSDLLAWDADLCGGIFTFGGKGTNIYASKIALNKIDKSVLRLGCNKNYFMITTSEGHPCHVEAGNWIGIGTDNVCVIGWIYLFFKGYDFEQNPSGFDESILQMISAQYALVSEFQYADSLGIDFHKMGFCPYNSSLFLLKDKNEFQTITDKKIVTDIQMMGDYNPYNYTLELSRSAVGPVSALVTIKSLGIQGFRQILYNYVLAASSFRKKLDKLQSVLVLNSDSFGFAVLFCILPQKYYGLTMDKLGLLNDEDFEAIRQNNVRFGQHLLNESLFRRTNVFLHHQEALSSKTVA